MASLKGWNTFLDATAPSSQAPIGSEHISFSSIALQKFRCKQTISGDGNVGGVGWEEGSFLARELYLERKQTSTYSTPTEGWASHLHFYMHCASILEPQFHRKRDFVCPAHHCVMSSQRRHQKNIFVLRDNLKTPGSHLHL